MESEIGRRENMYTIIDLLDKLITIEQRGYEMYKLISLMDDIDSNIKLVARILASEELRHSQIYKDLKKEMEKIDLPKIDFSVYDKASNLISSFRYPTSGHIASVEELLRFALDFEEQGISLVMSIQGLLIRETQDSASITYNVLTQIIEEERKHIENIERFLPKVL